MDNTKINRFIVFSDEFPGNISTAADKLSRQIISVSLSHSLSLFISLVHYSSTERSRNYIIAYLSFIIEFNAADTFDNLIPICISKSVVFKGRKSFSVGLLNVFEKESCIRERRKLGNPCSDKRKS